MKIRITSKSLETARLDVDDKIRWLVALDSAIYAVRRSDTWRAEQRPIREDALADAREILCVANNKINAPIDVALAAVNGKAREWTIFRAGAVRDIADAAETELVNRGVKKGNLPGTVVTYRPSAPKQAAYKYDVKSTEIELTRTSGGWFLTNVKTVYLSPCKKECFEYSVPEAAHTDILAQALDCVAVQKLAA